MKYIEETKLKLVAVDCLKALKQGKTFRELSKEINLPAGVINRYINGSVLPNEKRSKKIIDMFYKKYFEESIIEKSKAKGSKFYVTSWILSNPFFLNIISYKILDYYNEKIDKVLTAATDGLPIAINVADSISCKAVWAKKYQEISFTGFYVSDDMIRNKPVFTPFYIPKEYLNKKDKVLIVDDVIRGGTTINSLINLCKKAKCEIVGIFAIFMTKSVYYKLRRNFKTSSIVLIEG